MQYLFPCLVLATLLPLHCSAQGCSNRCPPLNYGKEVTALCEGDVIDSFADVSKSYPICHPSVVKNQEFKLSDFRGVGRATVIANYYSGCNAGRRESGVFAHVAQRFYDKYGDRVTFIQSVKGGGTCEQWAEIYQEDAIDLYPDSEVIPKDMPLTIQDENYQLRDDLFTTPFGHPSYVVLDEDLEIKHKFIGPCCGYESYFTCTAEIAKSLDTNITAYLEPLLGDATPSPEPPNAPLPTPTASPTQVSCQVQEFSEWSECSVTCGSTKGTQFRWRQVSPLLPACPTPVETRVCTPLKEVCNDEDAPCISEFGNLFEIDTVASDFHSPRDVAFHPTPGLHLGTLSEGREFHPNEGEEAWVVNGGNHSVSIIASLGTASQTTISRRDRGYYHYMINGTSLAFNEVKDSGRSADRDGYKYWAICNDNTNTYLGTKEPNFFMGPTLYNSDPNDRNTVNRLGESCNEGEPCYFLHSDMLHESPGCIGIAHDPELETSYGNVYWAFDATGNRQKGQLVRFDFQQPHGPGSMDHSVAAIRRYVEVELERGPPGVHAGLAVHPTRREVYIAVPGANQVLVVGADSGEFARTAREEYPIFSSRLPSFEYSIWECSEQRVFASGLDMPTGLVLSKDGKRLFVAERGTGQIHVFEVETASRLYSIDTDFKTIGGMALNPVSDELFFVDEETNTLNRVKATTECFFPIKSRLNAIFSSSLEQTEQALGETNILWKDFHCVVDPIIPDSSFFDQVHDDTGYADEDPDVQSDMVGMDEAAALLEDRTDCGYDSELNFDALLLGGYFCHLCLPELDLTCDYGGTCSNVQWRGFTCDNEFVLSLTKEKEIKVASADGTEVEPSSIRLKKGMTYRFTVIENDVQICTSIPKELGSKAARRLYGSEEDKVVSETVCASSGPLLIPIDSNTKSEVSFFVANDPEIVFLLSVEEKKPWTLIGLSIGGASAFVIALIAVTVKKRLSTK